MKEYLKPMLTLFIIVFLSSLLVSLAYNVTKGPSLKESNSEKNTSMKEVVSSADDFKNLDIENGNSSIEEVLSATKGGENIGYIIINTESSYGGIIKVMTGINTDGSIAGVRVIEHEDTPGLGAKSTEPEFYNQYNNLSSTSKIVVVKPPTKADNSINAITGATITSNAVTLASNNAIDYYNKFLKGGK